MSKGAAILAAVSPCTNSLMAAAGSAVRSPDFAPIISRATVPLRLIGFASFDAGRFFASLVLRHVHSCVASAMHLKKYKTVPISGLKNVERI